MPDWVTVARIARPRGLRGEVVADGVTENAERLLSYQNLKLFPTAEAVTIESLFVQGDRFVLKLKGIDSIEAAERLRNAEIRIERDDLPQPPEGEIYYADLLECVVADAVTQTQLGVVSNCLEYGGPMILEVSRPDREPMLIPFVPAICTRVDTAAKRIEVNLPAGLEDLDRP